mmetsp:Transcript_20430/g.53178  ORF Transcript_20430/g.53178 Transcript_20430/m.53178 type:complete len:419 (-) Transcript_20430:197-1453(-)|eukprot:CAMPEP_0182925202 /NCGR_PEP_ID=MMETSP0105_2-20130417/8538_1 /TAXON_ID=81532 ORGANISM="Acanthoeca-like sp., Strain 10tr" /NCGR_SAMPLE_ID=MMETSP0105_2 /ASSEMBLY_ACC=CAM_ASM_000205 /LENGTH=418 /DNA_ID=CAMNT_0025063037 /DNA_START=38 /DNA_END=1294 /DNA_ORIENTATION=-
MTISVVVATAASVLGHGSMTIPRPRNAIDGTVAPWNGTVPAYPIPFDFPTWCATPDASSNDPRHLTGAAGQACFWFNNGCDIGCDKCDGQTGQKIPCCSKKFNFVPTANLTSPMPWGADGLVVDKAFVASFNRDAERPSTMTHPEVKPTVCDPRLRTLNTQAECGSPEDFWYNAPWRYPGKAPVTDSCGTAGGVLPGQSAGTAGATYVKTVHATVGDLGSKVLRAMPTGVTWTAGTDVEVAWTQKAWHGGGYTYRICPADQPLNEECFQKTPLQFVGNSSLRWGGVGGEQVFFNSSAKGWEVSSGTIPEGSTWRKCPLPRGPWSWDMSGPSFEPVCEESEACKSMTSGSRPKCLGPDAPCTCKCSGDGIGDLPQLEIVDKVHIPATLPAGKYVVGWRWDCEESTQVWASCADVEIVAA